MDELKRALRPVKRRMRLQQAAQWTALGALAEAMCILLLRVATFLWPLDRALLWAILLGLGLPVLSGLAALLWPVSDLEAASQADRLGLMARAQTAVMLRDDDGPMAQMQRQDAVQSLKGLAIAKDMPVRIPKPVWVGLIACAAVIGCSFLLPNPQTEILNARRQFRKEMQAQAEKIDKVSDTLDESKAETPEIRRLLADLSKELRRVESRRDALGAADQTERKLMNLRDRTAAEAMNALKDAGLDGLAQALESGNSAEAKEALSGTEAASLLNAAAQTAEGAAGEMLGEALKALNAGNVSKALEALQNAANGSSVQTAQAMALASMARSSAAQSGQSAASAASGKKGSGAGAGTGSSNQDGGKSGKQTGSNAQGSAAPQKSVKDYESIYDPTRLGGSGEMHQASGQMGEGSVMEIQAGLGAGSLDGSVPYRQALPEYTRAATEAAENAGLPAYAQKWIQDYFDSLK